MEISDKGSIEPKMKKFILAKKKIGLNKLMFKKGKNFVRGCYIVLGENEFYVSTNWNFFNL